MLFVHLTANDALYLRLSALSGKDSLGGLKIRNGSPFLSFVRGVQTLNGDAPASAMNETYKPEHYADVQIVHSAH